jgi:hypothetical protein
MRPANARVRASNAWYRLVGRRVHGWRAQCRNWLNRRARARGKDPLPDRLTRAVGSRVPGYRNRINPATGRPRWTDRNRAALARWRAASRAPAPRQPSRQPPATAPRARRARERSR